MPAAKDRGFLLQKIPFSETSLILKVFTRRAGLVTLVAKGAKRPQSKLRGHLDFFSELECVYYPNTRSEIWTLAETSTLRAFGRLKSSPERQALGQVMAEVLLRYGHGSAEPEGFYRLLAAAWERLDSGEPEPDASGPTGLTLVARYLLGVCQLGGFGPRFGSCHRCGEVLPMTGPVRFQWADGATVCASCGAAEGESGAVRLRAGWAAVLRDWCGNGPTVEEAALPPASVKENALEERDGMGLLTFLLQYLGRHSGGEKPLRAWAVWKEMHAGKPGLPAASAALAEGPQAEASPG